jgi:AmiR/NasT family two-component response regulator
MCNSNSENKEFLLVDENPETVLSLVSFFKICKLENKVIHAWNHDEAKTILKSENISNFKLIIIQFDHSNQVDLIRHIRDTSELEFTPIVILASSWGDKEFVELKTTIISAVIFNPLDFTKFKRIIALAGYNCKDNADNG